MAEGEKKGSWGELGGPSGRMHDFKGVGTQTSGVSSQEGSGGRSDMGPLAGGKEAFVSSGASNKDYAGTATAGGSGPTKSGGNQKWAEGGSTRMFGNTGSKRAEPA